LQANHIFEKKSEETRKEVTTSQIANADKNEHIIDKSNMNKQITNTSKKDEVKEAVKEKREEDKRKNTAVVQTSSTNESTQANNSNKKIDETNYGTFGRLYVSSYNVALYDYNVNTASNYALQTLVDNKDSAAYYKNNGKLVIADHYNQGFRILVNLTEGSTAYIKFEDGTTLRYSLIKKSEGTNTGPDLVDKEGNSFFSMDSDLIMYTCYEGGIMATLWTLS
ncbi:MAG: hypothetical protein K6G37_01595, partial [Bacilli bacterium]|nr:hypothetical protein [Bacilli bacterium]